MKLINKISLNVFITTALLFLAAGAAYYWILASILNDETREELFEEKNSIVRLIKRGIIPANPPFITVNKTHSGRKENLVTNIDIEDYEDGEPEAYMQLKCIVEVNGQNYEITVRKSMLENDELIYTIVISLALLFLALITTVTVINYITSQKLFRTFYKTIELLKGFNITVPQKPVFPTTAISEFMELQKSLDSLVERIIRDYNKLKEFTENASHELQTPLSIIKNKCEIFIQDKGLNSEQSETIESVLRSVNRLSRLNKSLLLLSRIDSSVYKDETPVTISTIINKITEEWAELLEMKNINLEIIDKSEFVALMNPSLAEILVGNLLDNAIKHNLEGGCLIIETSKENVIFMNSSKKPVKEPEKIFDRFCKENQASDSHGLGLAIVKSICSVSGLEISYHYEKNMNSFILKKN